MRFRSAVAIAAGVAVPVPLLLFNPEFAVGPLEHAELWGAATASVLLVAAVGALVWRGVGATPASGAWWFTCAWLAASVGFVGWTVAGGVGVAALVPLAGVAGLRVLGRRAAGSSLALLAATVLGVGALSAKLLVSTLPAPPSRQVVVIGLDAASWDIIDPLRAAGRLPTFDALLRRGARGDLDSVFPVISPPVWTSIATGKSPEKHGIKDFWGGSDQVQAKRVWEIADEHGLVSTVLGYLVTWPPQKRNGVLVPGWDAQGPETVPEDLSFLKQLEISEKEGEEASLGKRLPLVAAALRHGLTLSTVNAVLRGAIARRLGGQRPLDDALEGRLLKLYLTTDVFCQLMRTVEPGLAIYYYSSIDAIEHQFFKFYAPEGFSGLTPESIAEYRDAIPRVYEETDRMLARMLGWIAPGADVIIVSDHGQRAVKHEGQRWYRIKTTKVLDELAIDEKVRATNMGNEVYLRPAGSPADYATALAAIRSVVTVGDGQPLFLLNERPSGEALLRVSPRLAEGETKTAKLGEHVVPFSELFDASERISGEHTETAMVLLVGPDVAPGTVIPRGSVLDIAPTTLALLGLPVAHDMEGKVLAAALRPGVLDRLAVTYVDTYGAPEGARKIGGDIGGHKLDQLKALGYVE
jgi:hypothetical protein